MDRTALSRSLDRLVGLPGEPMKGIGAEAWGANLGMVDRPVLMHAVIEVVKLLLAEQLSDDNRPQRAIEAAEAWLANPSAENLANAKATAKACTAARSETFGLGHRCAEAARAVAWAAGAKDSAHLFAALAATEEELLARLALTSEFHKVPEQRRAMVDVLRRELLPKEEAPPPPPPPPVSLEPVPYRASARFELGQRIVHKTFGEVSVVSVDATMVEVALADGSRKRLVHARG